MTIGIGILGSRDVLLCADTQVEANTSKYSAPKIGSFDVPGGRMAYALAGNASFAISVIQKCKRVLNKASVNSVMDALESTLDSEYNRLVRTSPRYLTDYNLPYNFLIAYSRSNEDCTALFATEENSLRAVLDYECIGIGKDLAHYLLGIAFDRNMPSDEIALLASYTLSRVKDSVPGCGGDSQFILLSHDGKSHILGGRSLDVAEGYAKRHDFLSHHLLLSSIRSLKDEEFESEFKLFESELRAARDVWVQDERRRSAMFEAIQKTKSAQKSN